MQIELKNIKIAKSLSEETLAFSATIYVNGKKAGHASNHGQGGPTDYNFNDPTLRKQCEAYAKSLPAEHVKLEGVEDMVIPMDLEHLIDNLVDLYEIEKERVRVTKQFQKWCAEKTLFRLKGDKPGNYRTLTGGKFCPAAKTWLDNKYPGQVIEILNETITNPQALKTVLDELVK